MLAVADRGTMYDPSAVFYMDKLVTGPEAADVVDIRLPVAENIKRIAKAKKETVEDVTVVMLDRPRHQELAAEVRDAGARLRFISDGDVAGAIMAARDDTGIDLLLGIGGTPEGIITACAIKCLGGVIQGRLWPQDDDERQRAIDAGHDLDRVLSTDDLVTGENCFFVATGITDGELLKGVRYRAGGATTHSLVMRSKSGTIRLIESHHQLAKLRAYCLGGLRPRRARRAARPTSCPALASLVIGEAPRRHRAPTPTGAVPSTSAAARPTSPSGWPGWATPVDFARVVGSGPTRRADRARTSERDGVDAAPSSRTARTPPPRRWPRLDATAPRPTTFDLDWDLPDIDLPGRHRPRPHRVDRGRPRAGRRRRHSRHCERRATTAPSPTTPTSARASWATSTTVRARIEEIIGRSATWSRPASDDLALLYAGAVAVPRSCGRWGRAGRLARRGHARRRRRRLRA